MGDVGALGCVLALCAAGRCAPGMGVEAGIVRGDLTVEPVRVWSVSVGGGGDGGDGGGGSVEVAIGGRAGAGSELAGGSELGGSVRGRSERVGDVLAIVPRSWCEPGPAVVPDRSHGWSEWWVLLTDGQVIGGDLMVSARGATEEQGEGVVWSHPVLGSFSVAIEDVLAIGRDRHGLDRAGVGGTELPDQDVVVTRNGDEIVGLVDRIVGGSGGEVFVDRGVGVGGVGGGVVGVPMGSVERMTLVNEPRAGEGSRLWLSDGSVVDASWVEGRVLEGAGVLGEVEFAPRVGGPGGSVRVLAGEVLGLELVGDRVMGLGELELVRWEVGGGRRWGERVRVGDSGAVLGAEDVVIRGAGEAEWELPEGAGRLGGWVELMEGAEPWGDCVVVVEELIGGEAQELWRGRVRREEPAHWVGADLTGGERVRVRVEEGERGPILDWVVLRRMVVGVE